jgi:hypothetical protein
MVRQNLAGPARASDTIDHEQIRERAADISAYP